MGIHHHVADAGEVKKAVISCATASALTIVSGVAGYAIRVLDYDLVVNGSNQVRWLSGTTLKSGPFFYRTGGGISSTFSPFGKFQCANSAALKIKCSAVSAVGGNLNYQMIPST